jgi:hypothetical protein
MLQIKIVDPTALTQNSVDLSAYCQFWEELVEYFPYNVTICTAT